MFIYAKLENGIQLLLTLKKLCHIKRDHLVMCDLPPQNLA